MSRFLGRDTGPFLPADPIEAGRQVEEALAAGDEEQAKVIIRAWRASFFKRYPQATIAELGEEIRLFLLTVSQRGMARRQKG